MLSQCFSLSDTQFPILLLLLITQVALYRHHAYFQYGVVATLVLIALYPIFFDALDRELFSLLFTVILIGYTTQMIYLAIKGVVPAVAASVVLVVYTLLFFFVSTTINAALFFTRPIDAAVGLYGTGEKIVKFSSRWFDKKPESRPSLSSDRYLESGRE